jgi:hypothetical protein
VLSNRLPGKKAISEVWATVVDSVIAQAPAISGAGASVVVAAQVALIASATAVWAAAVFQGKIAAASEADLEVSAAELPARAVAGALRVWVDPGVVEAIVAVVVVAPVVAGGGKS